MPAVRLEDAYRVLDLAPHSSEEQVRAAHRDLTKVWHPDRFANDPAMQRKAEEKLKRINEALEVIRAGGARYVPSPEPRDPRRRGIVGWGVTCALLALFILVRRPTLGGLLVATILFAIAAVLMLRK